MLRKLLLFSVPSLFLAFCNANSIPLNCGTMTPADCKKEVGVVMDKEIRTMFTERMKIQMIKTIDIYSKVKAEMPADGVHAKILMEAIEHMNTDMTMIDKMDGMSVEDMAHLWLRCFFSLNPDLKKAQKEDSANADKFKELMIKHGWSAENVGSFMMILMKDFEDICMEMLNELRSEDFKEYPEYMKIKELLIEMKVSTGSIREQIFLRMMRKLLDFTEIPFMKAFISTLFII